MGKGLAAALIMAMARILLHSAIGAGQGAPGACSPTSTTVWRATSRASAALLPDAGLAVYDPATGRLTVAKGGHNPVLVVSRDGVQRLTSRGAPSACART